MSTKSHLTSIALVATVGCLLAGCGKSGATSASNTGHAAGAAAAAQTAAGSDGGGAGQSALAALGAGGDVLDVSKECKAIKQADAQSLMKADVGAVVINPEECAYSGGAMKVSIHLSDADKSEYTALASPAPDHLLTGIGDEAFWFQPVPQRTVPWLSAHKGSVSCDVSPADPVDTTLAYTGNPPLVTISDSDAAAYAQKEGTLCNEAFSAAP